MVNAARISLLALVMVLTLASAVSGQDVSALKVDRDAREVRIGCEMLPPDYPLEYICVGFGTAEHESLLRTRVKPSAVHAALVGLGLEPGRPVRWVPEMNKSFPPSGPPLWLDVEWTTADGAVVRRPIGEVVRHIESKRPMPRRTFVFTGSTTGQMRDGSEIYSADATGQLISLVNFETPTIDVGELKSSDEASLEWEIDTDAAPPAGSTLWLIIKPIGDDSDGAATRPATADSDTGNVASLSFAADGSVSLDDEKVAANEVIGRLQQDANDGSVRVKLHVTRDASLATISEVLRSLADAGITDVWLANARPVDASDDAADVLLVDNGGGTVTWIGKPTPIIAWVDLLAETPKRDRPIIVRPAKNADDIEPIDLAAPAAAAMALGYDVYVDDSQAGKADRFAQLRADWEARVLPQADAMRVAAQTHYEVMQAYQDEINRLLDEAERLRREMDDLQRRFDEMTTPQPSRGQSDE